MQILFLPGGVPVVAIVVSTVDVVVAMIVIVDIVPLVVSADSVVVV